MTPKPIEEVPATTEEVHRFKLSKEAQKHKHKYNHVLKFKQDEKVKVEEFKCDFEELPVFNITNPNICIPCGVSGYVPYQCHVNGDVFAAN